MPIEIQNLTVDEVRTEQSPSAPTSATAPMPDLNESIRRWHLDDAGRRDRLRAD